MRRPLQSAACPTKCPAISARPVGLYDSYVVRIDVFAEPSSPPISAEELQEADFSQQLADLMQQLDGVTEEQMQDDVHRRFEYRLCPACHKRFLANPLGKPRGLTAGNN